MRVLASGLLSVALVSSCGVQKIGSASDFVPCAGAGTICTWAGTGDPAFTGEGGAALATALYWPMDVEFAPDRRGATSLTGRITACAGSTPTGVQTVIGTDEIGDGPVYATGTRRRRPACRERPSTSTTRPIFSSAPDGNTMFLAAWHNHKIRKLDLSHRALVEVACGSGPGFAGDGRPGGGGAAEHAEGASPRDLGRSVRRRHAQLPRSAHRRRRPASSTTVVGNGHARHRGRRRPGAGGRAVVQLGLVPEATPATTPSRAARWRWTPRGASTSPTPRTSASVASTSRPA